jgi:hypothetical protein
MFVHACRCCSVRPDAADSGSVIAPMHAGSSEQHRTSDLKDSGKRRLCRQPTFESKPSPKGEGLLLRA